MKKNLGINIIILLILFSFVISSFSPAQELSKLYLSDNDVEFEAANNILSQQMTNDINTREVVVGEKLDPIGYSPGFVEHMDDVIARDLLQRSNLDSDLKDTNSRHGIWIVPSIEATYYPRSGKHNVINKGGDTEMGISFPTNVDIHGAWFAGQGGGEGVWASRIRAIGYLKGEKTQTTDWFEDIDDIPSWFAMNLQDVDRIVIEAIPVFNGAGWYAMDDLTYSIIANTEQPNTIVLDFEDCSFNQNLNTSNYANLTWETGTGNFYVVNDEMTSSKKLTTEYKKDLFELDKYGKNSYDNGHVDTTRSISDFQGVIRGDAGSWSYPPDSCGAVGPNHYVEVVNRNFAVYNKSTGEELINILLGAFLPGSNGDPRVLYDQYSNRWFVIVCDFETQIYLAVSTSDDPTGSWFKCSFVVSQGSDAGRWPDYPTLGVDVYGIYTGAYMVGGSSMSIFALDKAPLIASEPSLGDIYAFRNLPWEGAIQPVHTFGTTEGEYFVSRMSSTGIRVRLLTDLLTNPVLTEVGNATIPSHSEPPDAPALNSTTPLDTVGHRLMNAVYRDGYIWTAHCIGIDGRAASRWYKISTSEISLADNGTVSDSVMNYFFPSIMVNAGGDVIMGFSGSHSGQYAAAYYTGRLADYPPGVMDPPVLIKPGEASYNLIDSYGRNRWGDYSLCSLDPTNEHTLWTIQEYAHSHNESDVNRWGTWIDRINYGNQPPFIPDAPDGPEEGTIDVEYAFTAGTSDPDGDDVYYYFDWGDNTSSGWVGPYNSGEPGEAFHAWTESGVYKIRVKAIDDLYGDESNWSTTVSIHILQPPILDITCITGGLFKIKSVIQNLGEIDATNVSWRICLDGGAFIGKETSGIETIPVGEEVSVNSNLIFGLGPTTATVTAEIPESSDMREQTGFVFLFFIKVNPCG